MLPIYLPQYLDGTAGKIQIEPVRVVFGTREMPHGVVVTAKAAEQRRVYMAEHI